MVARSFFAFDNSNLTVTSSSSASIVGNGVINNSSTPDGSTFTYTEGSGQSITLDDTGGDADIFEDDDSSNHVITDGGTLVSNGANVEAESFILVRALDENGDETGPTISITVFSQGGVFSDVWGLSSDIPLVGGTSYVKVGGSNLGSSAYNDYVTCFAKGTAIDTPDGPQSIETLSVGDLVRTRDSDAMPIRWIGHRSVLGRGNFAPVRIAKGVLGNTDTLVVSPEHRVLMDGPIVELLFGAQCVLVAAKFLVGLQGITQKDVAEVTYYHLLLDSHQIISGANCWSESFFLAENAMSGLDRNAQHEMRELFPDILVAEANFGGAAEMILKNHEAELLKALMMKRAHEGTKIAIAA
jgi:hypothetical protein